MNFGLRKLEKVRFFENFIGHFIRSRVSHYRLSWIIYFDSKGLQVDQAEHTLRKYFQLFENFDFDQIEVQKIKFRISIPLK